MKHLEKYIGIILLLFAIGFNLWIYRLEPTAKADPNDNTFQYALVDRTNQIWDFAVKKYSPFLLFDHWVPNWAQGYNLPSYYSHIPQIAIVASYRFLSFIRGNAFSLFQYYHIIIYLLLSFFPLSLFLALRIIGMSWLAAGVGALIASQLSTDGLYGLDPASFLWRGWGLSSQLFAMIWLPLALAFAYRGKTVPAILTLAATTAGHLGIGIITFMSVAVLAWKQWKKLPVIFGGVLLLLGYWIIPILIDGNYHNISVWDSIWKFDSFGYREVLKNLFNGDLFDFGRLPILTILVFVGLFACLLPNSNSRITDKKKINSSALIPDTYPLIQFGILFLFWLLLYFGRTTWGGLVDLIPGMSEFHLSRFIVGVHIAGLFLIPMGFEWIGESVLRLTYYVLGNKKSPVIPNTNPLIRLVVTGVLLVILYPALASQTIRYARHNDFLIKRANENYEKDTEDVSRLFSVLRSQFSVAPGRVFAGRGGSWGKDFRIAETPIYMHLSTYGIPVILWLPETWSPNSDTEQYFSENNPAHYALYNVRYVVTPIDLDKQAIQPFWKPLESGRSWRLYSVDFSSVVIPGLTRNPSSSSNTGSRIGVRDDNTDGYITSGVRPAIVSTSKTDYRSLIRLWMHADYIQQGLYPELTFDKNYPKTTGLPNFRMLDEVTYKVPALPAQAGGTTHNLFSEIPRYLSPTSPSSPSSPTTPTVLSQSSDSDMVFSSTVEVPKDCTECLVILRQSFHPSWRATIDGKPAQTMTVFPFYVAVSVPEGAHEVVFSYEPSGLKIVLLLISLISLITPMFLRRITSR